MQELIKKLRRISESVARIFVSRIFRYVHHGDIRDRQSLVRRHWVPDVPHPVPTQQELDHWKQALPGFDASGPYSGLAEAAEIPFVYEKTDAPHLERFRNAFSFPSIVAGAKEEYEAMLKLATWLGSRWDHGVAPVPGGTVLIDLVGVVEAGMKGNKYWCEIAAKTAVQAFASMGWPARLITSSRDGFTWEHAVLEAWSGRFGKWFVLDTDFNVVFESEGIPQSAYELCHDGPRLKAEGKLHPRMLGASKPSLPMIDLLPFFAYIHVDLRSDWYTRRLRFGSPVGGDLATWWTARPDFPRLLTAKVRVDDRKRFDWPVDSSWILLEGVEKRAHEHLLRVRFYAYSPYFLSFQVSLDGGDWKAVDGSRLEVGLLPGPHSIGVRAALANGTYGRPRSLDLVLPEFNAREMLPGGAPKVGAFPA